MKWLRLYITEEGTTERVFADQVLKPHLENFSIEVKSRVVFTNRKLGKRGGVTDFAKLRGDLTRLMHEDRHPEARFTTMVDLYALPHEFPGWDDARKKALPLDRVFALETALQTYFADWRFLPYIQLHEFETLLYCDLSELQRRIAHPPQAFEALAREVTNLAPEDINEGTTNAPSKRIIRHVPLYERAKVRVGATAVAGIGLEKIRAQCPHFDLWVNKLEKLADIPTPE